MITTNYRGHVENGVIVLDEPADLAEGMVVEVLASMPAQAAELADNDSSASTCASVNQDDDFSLQEALKKYREASGPTTPAQSAEGPTFYKTIKDFIGCIDDLPPDFAARHDHYIHGTPKR